MSLSDEESRLAKVQFANANQLYVEGKYDEALSVLSELDAQYPGNINLLKAMARTLAKLGRRQKATEICDRLISEFGYKGAAAFRDRVAVPSRDVEPAIEFESDAIHESDDDSPPVEMTKIGGEDDASEPPKEKRFRVKPVRLGLLVLIAAGMYFGYVPYWLGGGLIAAYFIVKIALGKAFIWLFSLPFKMKGRALQGATAELRGIEWTEKPKSNSDDDADDPAPQPAKPLRYAWLDVTITPPVRTQGFTHWEPGELMVAPANMKIRKLDDMDKCFRIHEIKYLHDGQEIEDDGSKFRGPLRMKILAEFPHDAAALKLVYYSFTFGDLRLT